MGLLSRIVRSIIYAMLRTVQTVAYHTLGCKLNYAETATINRDLESRGYATLPFDDVADLYVINTCTVTENADRDFRKLVNRIKRRAPKARIAAIGCYAQLKPERLSTEMGIDIVLGNGEKYRLAEYLQQDLSQGIVAVDRDLESEHHSFQSAYSLGDRTRTFLKVQDGCDYLCTYCTIPMARGRSVSDSADNILVNAREIAAAGVREIVLTGVNVGDYRWQGMNLESLLRELVRVDGIERIRISSIEPNLLTDAIIDLIAAESVLLPHLHLPLQSGSDVVLGRMKRRYQTTLYIDRVAAIRKAMPEAGIGADVIVGFPGETEDLFRETYSFIQDLDLSYLHVFTYSPRPDTEAVNLPAAVPIQEKKDRNRRLTMLGKKKWRGFAERNLGAIRPVLLEQNQNDWSTGLTDNYLRVKIPRRLPECLNTIVNVRLEAIDDHDLIGVCASW